VTAGRTPRTFDEKTLKNHDTFSRHLQHLEIERQIATAKGDHGCSSRTFGWWGWELIAVTAYMLFAVATNFDRFWGAL
jgi:hypothetical protein